MKTLYLCGGINGLTDDEAMTWREKVKHDLDGLYRFLDPMRRDYRGREDVSVEEIVRGDLADIAMSDVVLVAADRASWGTAMEAWEAGPRHLRKDVVVVCSGRVSPWLRHSATSLHSTLDDAIAHLWENA